MIPRSLIHVGGPPGAGKTTFIEAVLSRQDLLLSVARCRVLPSRSGRRSSHSTERELRRFRDAGAAAVAAYHFQPGEAAYAGFFDTDLMLEIADAIILEGDDPLGSYDLRVFVAPPPESEDSLFVRRSDDSAKDARRQLDHWVELLQQPEGLGAWTKEILGTDFGALLSGQSSLAEKLRADALSKMQQIRHNPAPEPRPRWAIQQRWAGIETAGLVVVNLHRADQRSAAGRLVEDVARLRRDPELCRDILGPLGSRVPITAVAADLHDPGDPGLRKALARVRRVLQRRP